LKASAATPATPGVTQEASAPLLDPTDRAFWTGLIVVALALVSALVTYLILTGLTPITPRNDIVLGALLLNVLLIGALIVVIAWQVAGLLKAWREKLPGARLHVRIVLLFSLIAALPTILLALAATTTFSRSLDGWFSSRARAIIQNSLDVAQSYLNEHGQVIRTDAANMARDIDAAADDTRGDTKALQQLLVAQSGLRELPVAYIVNADRSIVARSADNPDLPYLAPEPAAIAQAEQGQIVISADKQKAWISAMAKLAKHPGQYLYVVRGVSPKVMGHLRSTEQNVDEYQRLRKARGGLTLAHGLMYTMISMTALLAAIWVGMWFAGRFVAPVRRLIFAAQQVSTGDLQVEVPEIRGEGDLRRLSHTFNNMTRELKHQRDALVTANEQLLERRRFMEAVLSGVSAGVIGLDNHGNVTLLSRSAEQMLGVAETHVAGRPLSQVLPVFAPVVEGGDEGARKPRARSEVTYDANGEERTFAVRVTREKAGVGEEGSVITFDDITELVSAQRTSAWADVARRIAHEIKNPLTPIILSAERLRRKYGKTITGNDRETFDKLTATIERQAGDIKTMVDEFAAFARVPKPVIEIQDLRESVQEPVVLFREGHPGVSYNLDVPAAPIVAAFDRRLITQAVTNLVKNATEAVEQRAETQGKAFKPRVDVVLGSTPSELIIDVIDNGVGLPKQNRSRLLEPYVTTKGSKGTGLGLAIVQKITEQHGGTLTLEDAPPRDGANGPETGARVRLSLPRRTELPASQAVDKVAGEAAAQSAAV
jgi:two-component system nitrogen regulation sensor histidine kinase NtrY